VTLCQEPDAPDFVLLSEGRERRCNGAPAKCNKQFTAIIHATPYLGIQYARIWKRQLIREFSAAGSCAVSTIAKTKCNPKRPELAGLRPWATDGIRPAPVNPVSRKRLFEDLLDHFFGGHQDRVGNSDAEHLGVVRLLTLRWSSIISNLNRARLESLLDPRYR